MRFPSRRLTCLCCLVLFSSACGSRRVALPSGPGAPFPAFADAYAEATGGCRGIRTITASMALSGRAGDTKLRGRVDGGFAEPAQMRLEGLAPFGRPVFIMVARGESATLVLPRDNRVLRGARPAGIVDALAGVALGPQDLRAVISGCGLAGDTPSAGRAYGKDWAALDAGGATLYLRRTQSRWRLVAASRPPLTIEYAEFASGRPSVIHLRTSATPGADLSLRLSAVNINVDLGGEAFEVEVPPGAEPLTLDELRRAGPLGGRD